jgi:hypothetical protein
MTRNLWILVTDTLITDLYNHTGNSPTSWMANVWTKGLLL